MNSLLPVGKNDEEVAGAGRPLALIDFEPMAICFEDPEAEETRRVIYGHFLDLSHLDVERLMLHYAPGCRLSDGVQVWEGKEAIGGYYKDTLQQLARYHTKFRLLHLEIQGKMAFLTWEQENERLMIPFGSTTFIVYNGLITRQQLIACECGSGTCIHLY